MLKCNMNSLLPCSQELTIEPFLNQFNPQRLRPLESCFLQWWVSPHPLTQSSSLRTTPSLSVTAFLAYFQPPSISENHLHLQPPFCITVIYIPYTYAIISSAGCLYEVLIHYFLNVCCVPNSFSNLNLITVDVVGANYNPRSSLYGFIQFLFISLDFFYKNFISPCFPYFWLLCSMYHIIYKLSLSFIGSTSILISICHHKLITRALTFHAAVFFKTVLFKSQKRLFSLFKWH
jgi:hypothetical protein